MKYRLSLLLLSGVTSVVLSGPSEVIAKASTAQQPIFPTNVEVDQITTSATYFLPQQSALKLESQVETLAESNTTVSAQSSEKTKIVITPTSQLLSAPLNNSPQLSTAQESSFNPAEADISSSVSKPEKVNRQIPTLAEAKLPPIPTTQNSAALLQQPPVVRSGDQTTLAQASTEEQFPPAEEVVPDNSDEVDPGRPTRSGTSYIGVGANFGVGGDTSLGDSGLFVYSKVGLTRYFSIRPAVNTDFEEDATFLLPLTFDLAPIAVGDTGVKIAPYFGGGPAVSTTGDFGPVLSGGIDLPLTERLTVTSGVNVGILDETDVGVFVGIGYTFPSLF